MSLSIGLTGGIGMGKSTTAHLFKELGAEIWDADAAVARAYAPNGAACRAMSAVFPNAVTEKGVDRSVLRNIVAEDPTALKRIESIVHPLLAEDRATFRRSHPDRVLIFDIPLLFETGLEREMDAVITVSVDPETQASRVLARPGMDVALLERLRARQLRDHERRERADYVIETMSLDTAHAAAASLMQHFQAQLETRSHARDSP